jgi:hypothetical protein
LTPIVKSTGQGKVSPPRPPAGTITPLSAAPKLSPRPHPSGSTSRETYSLRSSPANRWSRRPWTRTPPLPSPPTGLELPDCRDLAALRSVESQAAIAYWAAWRGIHATFTTRDTACAPEHWTRFGQRVSPLTCSPRVAVDPINAIANFLYALLEAESRIALTAIGLDPGILHTDQPARDSLALDLMEAGRPAVHRHLINLLAHRTFSARDFAETTNGQCRLTPRLASDLADTTLTWAGIVAPHAEKVAQLLAIRARLPPPPTLLTGETRRLARPAVHNTRPFRPPQPAATRTCQDCGVSISTGKRCRACHQAANNERLRRQQSAEATRRRHTVDHPSQRPEVRARIAEAQRAQWAARREADTGGGFTGTPSEFRRLIPPGSPRAHLVNSLAQWDYPPATAPKSATASAFPTFDIGAHFSSPASLHPDSGNRCTHPDPLQRFG